MADELDFNEIMLEAVADVQEIIREILADLAAPRVRGKVAQGWASSPDEMKEQFASERPDDYAALMNAIQPGKEY